MKKLWKWTFNDVAAVINTWSDQGAGGLIVWAMWTTDSLEYLEHTDERAFGHQRRILYGHQPDSVDLAHVRWAAGTSITAIDLCAAVLGRKHCGITGRDLGLSHFFQKDGPQLLASLPAEAQQWVAVVAGDPDYETIKRARNPMTHSTLPRTLQLSMGEPVPHGNRTLFPVGAESKLVDARDLIRLARVVAVRHVEPFLEGAMAGQY